MSNKPATKKDLAEALKEFAGLFRQDVKHVIDESIEEFAVMVKKGFDATDQKIEDRINGMEAKLDQKLDDTKIELKEHFDAAIEHYRDEALGMHQSQIEFLGNKQDNHEERITALEHRSGPR